MKRTASAHWSGNLKEGKGELTTQSNTLNKTQYSFNARFAEGVGTNPEELLGASHAGCFTMAVSSALTQAGFMPGTLDTTATVELDPAAGPKVTSIALALKASKIDGVSKEKLEEIANGAKENCPISKALAATPITLSVSYE